MSPLLLVLAAGFAAPCPTADMGYLYEPAFCADYVLRHPVRPYVPQPGDIFLATDEETFHRVAHMYVRSGVPHHSGIVFAQPDGRLDLLEGGPGNTRQIRVLNLREQLDNYFRVKRVWVRQRAVPLTPEQSYRLSAFALAAEDRPFAFRRMLLQGNPLIKAKGPLRTRLLGRPYAANFDPENPDAGMRQRYFCSELVTEACVAACLMPAETARPASTYPRELFFGTSRNPYLKKHLDMSDWLAPSRWTPQPGTEPNLKRLPFIDGDSGTIRRTP